MNVLAILTASSILYLAHGHGFMTGGRLDKAGVWNKAGHAGGFTACANDDNTVQDADYDKAVKDYISFIRAVY